MAREVFDNDCLWVMDKHDYFLGLVAFRGGVTCAVSDLPSVAHACSQISVFHNSLVLFVSGVASFTTLKDEQIENLEGDDDSEASKSMSSLRWEEAPN